MKPNVDIAVIVLTYNEQDNLSFALESVCGWAHQVFVVDSFSKDRTVEVAARYDCIVSQHEFVSESSQRNWSLTNLPIDASWIFFLDADEWMPIALRDEIAAVLSQGTAHNGFLLRWRLIWMGRWVKRGYYPKWLPRLVRRGSAKWEIREINPHLVVEGTLGRLQNDFIHENRKGLRDWSEKHIRYAIQEAIELFRLQEQPSELEPSLFGSQAQRLRWIRVRVYNRLPALSRPFFYFFYRVIIRLGFLDGWQAVVYHFLHAFWCPLLIDLFYLEMKETRKQADKTVASAKVLTP